MPTDGVIMLEELKCPRCSAPYKKKIPEWVTCIQCENCGTAILIPRRETGSQVTKLVYVEEVVAKPPKMFSLVEFSEFMRRKGYALDPISGLLKMGSIVISVSEEGVVEGPEPYRTRTEKWIAEYMKT